MQPVPVKISAKTMSLESVLRLHGEIRRLLWPLRLTPQQAGIMQFLQRHPGAKLNATAHALGTTSSSVAWTLEGLIKKGLMVKARPTDNHRVVALRLTSRGARVADKITARLRAMEKTDLLNNTAYACGSRTR